MSIISWASGGTALIHSFTHSLLNLIHSSFYAPPPTHFRIIQDHTFISAVCVQLSQLHAWSVQLRQVTIHFRVVIFKHVFFSAGWKRLFSRTVPFSLHLRQIFYVQTLKVDGMLHLCQQLACNLIFNAKSTV